MSWITLTLTPGDTGVFVKLKGRDGAVSKMHHYADVPAPDLAVREFLSQQGWDRVQGWQPRVEYTTEMVELWFHEEKDKPRPTFE